ncbi:hypothetical protein V6259_12840 [Marinomonas sp. TI.3.20]|uniref:hypothetical protein n=1 Tax=Marinomonas sp. TI.3.20 TaxID=3121296 RepID=UPI00311FB118
MKSKEMISRAWAVTNNKKVIAVVSMKASATVDFEEYSKTVLDCLSLVGAVCTGALYKIGANTFFLNDEDRTISEEGSIDCVCGGAWAAISNNEVISVFPMRVPSFVDFEKYRNAAKDCLSMVGRVQAGELVKTECGIFFNKRKNHKNRNGGDRSETVSMLVY